MQMQKDSILRFVEWKKVGERKHEDLKENPTDIPQQEGIQNQKTEGIKNYGN